MKKEKLFDIIGDIDDKYIEEAGKKKLPLKRVIFSVSSIAAVLCLIVLLSPLGAKIRGSASENKLAPDLPNPDVYYSQNTNELEAPNTEAALDGEITRETGLVPGETAEDILPPDGDSETDILPIAPVPDTDHLTSEKTAAAESTHSAADTFIPIDTAVDFPTVTVQTYVWYVSDKKLASASVEAEPDAENVFAAWKDKNGIEPEVELISLNVTDNAKTETVEFMGELMVQHTAATEWYMTVTVSRNLEKYFDTLDKELLCSSLEKTMVGFADKRNLASYQLVLE